MKVPAKETEWRKIEIAMASVVCDLCRKWARWRHPLGGRRCAKCPRPEK